MTTIIEDKQLDGELQELYCIAKLWVTDLEFLAQDLASLQKYLDKLLAQVIKQTGLSNEDYTMFAQYLLGLSTLELSRIETKIKVLNYLHTLDTLIDKTGSAYSVSLVETQALLERQISSLLGAFASLTRDVSKRATTVPEGAGLVHRQVYSHV